LIFGYIPVDFIPALMNAETLPKQVDKQVNRDLYGPPSEQKRKPLFKKLYKTFILQTILQN
jgi:hypothetical protein